MESPIALLLADTFMTELENSLIPNLSKINFWRCYVDDIICFVKNWVDWINNISVEQFPQKHSIYLSR